jgi:uncharacterized GH25 family protein
MTLVLAAAILALVSVEQVAAHDTFVLPEKFRVATGETVVIGFHSSDAFPESTQLIKRLEDPTVHLPGGSVFIMNIRPDGTRLVGSAAVPVEGHVIVTAINATATTDMKGDEFLEYLTEEGLTHVVAARAQRGEAEKPTRERYTMYAKSILVAGAPSEGFKTVVGLPIEMVPEKDPYRLKPGEALPIRVLYRGVPAADVDVKAASSGVGIEKQHSVGRTDANGRILIPVTPGRWRLHAIHMERSAQPDVEWESVWTTLTFEIPGEP